jgi:membrane protein DedA with SNARE-associated domain
VPDLSALLGHWRYPAIFVAVILGNVGLPVPEETVLALGGFLAERGELHLPTVIAVGVLAAIVGDNIGYWLGRRYGRGALERYGRYIGVRAERLEKVSAFMIRYGGVAVFVARFVAGARFLAGPMAGAMGIPPRTFTVANTLGALVYVPYAVGLGYAISHGAGPLIERFVGRAEPVVVAAIALLTLTFIVRRLLHRTPAR